MGLRAWPWYASRLNLFRDGNFSKSRLIALGSVLVCCAIVVAATAPRHKSSDGIESQRAGELEATPTADQQLMSPSDRAITQAIRKAIHRDKTLSSYGRNISIIMYRGKVTLQGAVVSNEERVSLEAKAAAVAGTKNVSSRLTVKSLR